MKKRLGDILVQQGSISKDALNRAIALQSQKEMRLGEILLQDRFVTKAEIAAALEQLQGIAYAECPPASIDVKVLERVSHAVALRCCALPLAIRGKELIVAMAEPQNLTFVNELRFRAGMEISRRFSFRSDVLLGIKRFYGDGDPDSVQESEPGDDVDLSQREPGVADMEFITADSREESNAAIKELNSSRQRTPAVRFVSNILALAAQKGASDIHIEPRVGNTIVRIRVDGILRELMTIPSDIQTSVTSRIKILANLDIAERRVPQDGRFLMVYRGERFDLRISTLRTHFGEKIAIRILDPRAAVITLDKLGLPDYLALDTPSGSGHHHGRSDPRWGNCGDRAEGGPDGSHGSF